MDSDIEEIDIEEIKRESIKNEIMEDIVIACFITFFTSIFHVY